MNDIDFIHAKNQLEILILKIENKYKKGNIPEEAESSLNSLYLALNVMLKQENYLETLKSELISINDKTVLLVSCSAASSPVFREGTDFFVRSNPATIKLEGKK